MSTNVEGQSVSPNDAKSVLYAGVFVGMRVVDEDGDKGSIIDCSDEHNILVQYDIGGSGFYCLAEGCPDAGGLYACI